VATGVVEISKPNSEVSVFHPVSVTLKTTGNSVVLGNAFVGQSKSVGVYDLGGKLIAMKTLKANEINLRKDLGVPSGIYIVKVKTLP
jgi:hypothetical protein